MGGPYIKSRSGGGGGRRQRVTRLLRPRLGGQIIRSQGLGGTFGYRLGVTIKLTQVGCHPVCASFLVFFFKIGQLKIPYTHKHR